MKTSEISSIGYIQTTSISLKSFSTMGWNLKKAHTVVLSIFGCLLTKNEFPTWTIEGIFKARPKPGSGIRKLLVTIAERHYKVSDLSHSKEEFDRHFLLDMIQKHLENGYGGIKSLEFYKSNFCEFFHEHIRAEGEAKTSCKGIKDYKS
jgi:hypothetical protein